MTSRETGQKRGESPSAPDRSAIQARYRDVRNVRQRICVQGVLELTSPCHVGGPDANSVSEQPLLKDSYGKPYLPGTTLAGMLRGVFRSALDDGSGDVVMIRGEPEAVHDLFGHDPDTREGEGYPASLTVDDAPLRVDRILTELREGVKLHPGTGIAEDKKLYDIELVSSGAQFELKLELELPDDKVKPQQRLKGLCLLLDALESELLAIGKRTRRGYGAFRMAELDAGKRWKVSRYEIGSKEGMLSWLLRERKGGGSSNPSGLEQDCADAAEVALFLNIEAPKRLEDREKQPIRIDVRLGLAGSMLIRSPLHAGDGADQEHLQRPALRGGRVKHEAILSGTALAGALRQHCRRIAYALAGDPPTKAGDPSSRRTQLDTLIFGDPLNKKKGHASRVRVHESVIEGGRSLRHTRLRIDPWTGGALEGYLFTSDPWYGGHIKLRLDLAQQWPEHPELSGPALALLLLALRDVAIGMVPVGGEGGTGRGWLETIPGQPFATVHRPGDPPISLMLTQEGAVEISPRGGLDKALEGLRNWLKGKAT